MFHCTFWQFKNEKKKREIFASHIEIERIYLLPKEMFFPTYIDNYDEYFC